MTLFLCTEQKKRRDGFDPFNRLIWLPFMFYLRSVPPMYPKMWAQKVFIISMMICFHCGMIIRNTCPVK